MFDFIKRLIAPPIGRYLINAISSSLKMKIVGFENYRFVKEMGKKCVIVFWHGQQFYPIYHFRNRKIAIMVSLSRDGDIQNQILSSFGYGVVRGSSSRGAVSGLIGMIKKMREGYDLALALDGPRGPLHQAKEGVNYIAIKEDCCILPIACAFNSFKLFSSSWDQYILPYPYSNGVMLVGRPIMPGKLKIPAMTHKHLEKILNAMTKQAEDMLKNDKDTVRGAVAAPDAASETGGGVSNSVQAPNDADGNAENYIFDNNGEPDAASSSGVESPPDGGAKTAVTPYDGGSGKPAGACTEESKTVTPLPADKTVGHDDERPVRNATAAETAGHERKSEDAEIASSKNNGETPGHKTAAKKNKAPRYD